MTNENRTQEEIDDIRMSLKFFKDNGQKVHIKIVRGEDCGMFRNGNILDVDDFGFLIMDRVIGSRRYSFEDVDSDIKPFREAGE
jgi:hypothetical protein